MKIYTFAHGRIDAENLTGREIREAEKIFGRLERVVIGTQIIPVDYRENQKPVEELSHLKEYIRRKNERLRRNQEKQETDNQ